MKARLATDLLTDILTEAEYAVAFVGEMNREALDLDPRTIRAVVRCFEIIGEAARLIPQDVRDRASAIPCQRMIGMRNRLAHDYIHTDIDILLSTTKHDLPPLIDAIRHLRVSLLSQMGSSTSGPTQS